MKTDKQLADELDAQERLEARGYVRETCPKCNGYRQFGSVVCWQCDGKGYIWRAPLTKVAEGKEQG